MKVGYFKYDVLMSANLVGSAHRDHAVTDPTKGTDCPFYMMDAKLFLDSKPDPESVEHCPFDCALFDCGNYHEENYSDFQNNADKVSIE